MATKVSDLTVDQFKLIISETVRDTMEDSVEDILALRSESYLKSIEEAREDYKNGKYKTIEELFE